MVRVSRTGVLQQLIFVIFHEKDGVSHLPPHFIQPLDHLP